MQKLFFWHQMRQVTLRVRHLSQMVALLPNKAKGWETSGTEGTLGTAFSSVRDVRKPRKEVNKNVQEYYF